jgi:FixJ family two-component response regulator
VRQGTYHDQMSTDAFLVAVVDDESSVRRALSRLLHIEGFEVETFASGAEFLESLKCHAPDCVVLDLHMPETDGFEVEYQLAQAGSRISIVVITGRDAPEDRERMAGRAVAAFLQKPIDGEVLLAAIKAARSSRSVPEGQDDSSLA